MNMKTFSGIQEVEVIKTDLPDDIFQSIINQRFVAVDIETTGLDPHLDRIATVQIYSYGLPVFITQINNKRPENIIKIIEEKSITKIFHYAVFDLGFIYVNWGVRGCNIACTKTASRLLDPGNRENHSLKTLLKKYLDVEIDKQEQVSNWSSPLLSGPQIEYAANDVIYLQELLERIRLELINRDLWDVALKCFAHLPTRVFLDVNNYPDIFLYK